MRTNNETLNKKDNNFARKQLQQNFNKMIKLSNKRVVESLLKDSSSQSDFNLRLVRTLTAHSLVPLKEDEVKLCKENFDKLYSLHKMEERAKEKLLKIEKIEEELKSAEERCECSKIMTLFCEKFENNSLTNTDVSRVVNVYNEMIHDLAKLNDHSSKRDGDG